MGLLLLAVALAFGFALLLSRASRTPDVGGLAPGSRAPEITAAGWLNGEPPEDRQGRVMFVHAWFTTCPHCRLRAPELVELHERFRSRGVIFVGLTFEGPESLPEVEAYVGETGMTWPNGYGAVETLRALEAEFFPAAWIIDRGGQVVWNSGSGEDPAAAMERALAQAPPGSSEPRSSL